MELISIGDISKAANVSTHRLRNYDKIGLVKPSFVDEKTNRRYYSKIQIGIVMLIDELRNLNFSLEDIKQILETENIQVVRKIYESKRSELEIEIEKMNKIKNIIEYRISHYKNILYNGTLIKAILNNENISLKPLPERKIFFIYEKKLITEESMIEAYQKIQTEIAKNNVKTIPPCMVIFHSDYESAYNEVAEFDVCRSLVDEEILKIKNKKFVKILPAGIYASIVFKGYKEASVINYNKLMEWIKKKELNAAGDLIKLYHINSFLTSNEEEFVSEFQILVDYNQKKY